MAGPQVMVILQEEVVPVSLDTAGDRVFTMLVLLDAGDRVLMMLVLLVADKRALRALGGPSLSARGRW